MIQRMKRFAWGVCLSPLSLLLPFLVCIFHLYSMVCEDFFRPKDWEDRSL